jgi:hypothetical protein
MSPDVEAWMVSVADADIEVSARLVAVTVTELGDGTREGAVYKPVAEIVPTVALPPVVPFAAQVTPAFVGSPTTAA